MQKSFIPCLAVVPFVITSLEYFVFSESVDALNQIDKMFKIKENACTVCKLSCLRTIKCRNRDNYSFKIIYTTSLRISKDTYLKLI